MRKGVNKVALRLFEHNEKAYRAAVRMMEQYGKAAIVHPTGTGKSYIAFKLIEDNPEKVVIWLSPSKYIFKTQLESLKRNDPDFPLANIHFYTYAKLMCCTQAQLDEIAAQKPAPKYVTTVYQYQKALAKYQARVDNLRTPGIQDVNQKYLDALRRALEQADGLDKVFADFKTDTGDRLKLLFCIDMLNEGVHVEGISGVILFRPTISPIIYKQQIARLDSIGMVWGNRNDRQWNQGYQEAKRYFEAHGDLRVPVNYVSPEGYALGKWVKRQRYTRQNPEKSCGALTEERMERLDAIGMIWNKMGS